MNRTSVLYSHYRVSAYKRRMWMIGGLILVIVIMLSLFFFSKTVTAQGSRERVKLVTSVEIKKGDTLWSIASNYMSYEYDDVKEYVEELKESNGLTTDTIHAGNYIIVPYYADASR
jgi:uncharacterized membrane protein YvbJ